MVLWSTHDGRGSSEDRDEEAPFAICEAAYPALTEGADETDSRLSSPFTLGVSG